MSAEFRGTVAFTPGPWAVHDHRDLNGNWWIGPGRFDTIAEVRHGHDDIEGDELANARLLAAAPDMLSVLIDVFENPKFTVAIGGNPNRVDDLMSRARAVLSRALESE